MDEAAGRAVAQLAAKLMAAEIALAEVIKCLPPQARREFAANLKSHAAATLHEHAEKLSPQSESAYALSIVAYRGAAQDSPAANC